MPDSAAAVLEMLEGDASGTWVGIDVVMLAFDLRQAAAYQLAKSEGWRSAPVRRRRGSRGSLARQYAFDDVKATWRRIKNPGKEPR